MSRTPTSAANVDSAANRNSSSTSNAAGGADSTSNAAGGAERGNAQGQGTSSTRGKSSGNPPSDSTDRHGRVAAILLVDGKDVAQIAMHERWGCPGNQRQRVDWGRPETPFADHLPMPEGVEEYEEDDNLS